MRIGLTGGIGSGKTTVARIFSMYGIPVYYADDRAKGLMNEDPVLRKKIRTLLGPEAYGNEGKLDRQYVASQVFADKAKLQKLESFVHPAVFEDSIRWHEAQKSPYTIKEAALLYESNSYKDLDKIIVVEAPDALRIKRVMERDETTEEAVRQRMANQLPQSEKIERADFVIHNNGKQLLIPQIQEIHQQILKLSKST
ncbi:MAG: dephospho-CoA kinase [Bacteroidetes bacterium]|nr:dephospho-CoA kinase [Bacteroidota bacterium]